MNKLDDYYKSSDEVHSHIPPEVLSAVRRVDVWESSCQAEREDPNVDGIASYHATIDNYPYRTLVFRIHKA